MEVERPCGTKNRINRARFGRGVLFLPEIGNQVDRRQNADNTLSHGLSDPFGLVSRQMKL